MNSVRITMMLALSIGLLACMDARAACLPCERPINKAFVPDTSGQANQFQVRRAGAEVDATWKINISEDGWYRVTQAQLVGAGIAPAMLAGANLRLFNHTQEVAIAVSTDDLFAGEDAFFFYGQRYDGEYTRTNAYWLGFGDNGKRQASVSGEPHAWDQLRTTTCYRVRHDPKLLYRPFHQPLDSSIDHWFAALVTSTAGTMVLLDTTNRIAGDAHVTLQLYGLSAGNHQTRIRVNGNLIAAPTHSGATYYSTNYTFPAAWLSDGLSDMRLRELVDGSAVYLIDVILDYPGNLRSTGPEYYFCGAPGTNVYRVTGMATNNGFRLLDVTRPAEPVQILDAQISTNGATYTLHFEYASDSPPRFLLVEPAGIRTPPAPGEVAFRNLADIDRQADYLMICPRELRQQAYRLAKHRYTNGLTVAVAPLADIYDEFGYGVMDANAIKQFIGYAYHHWTAPRPRFAVLIGEGTDDPLGPIGSVPSIHVPVKFGPTPFVVAAQDAWYGLVDGNDLLMDVAVGRIAVSSNAQLSNVVNKIMAFEGASIVSNALLVADNDGKIDFIGSSDTNIDAHLAAAGYSRVKVHLPNANARSTIQSAINNGRRLVTYMGHGAVDRWSAQNIWNTNDVLNLNNTIYPVVAIFSCNNGSFVHRTENSLAEVFIEAPRGASSTFAPTALSVQTFSDYVAAGFARAFAVDKRRNLGDVARDAQVNLWTFNANVAELLTYQIIGDPGLVVNPP